MDENILKEAVKRWGVELQVKMLAEEAVELAHAALKLDRQKTLSNLDHLAEETADVMIMIAQMDYALPCDFQSKVAEYIGLKMARLKDRLGPVTVHEKQGA